MKTPQHLIIWTTCLLLGLWQNTSVLGQSNWLRRAGGNNLDEAMDVAVSSTGSYYTTGYFSGTANFQVSSQTSSGLSDAFVVGYDYNGEPQWSTSFGGPGSDRALAVAANNAEIVVAGFFYGTANFGPIQLTAADSGDVFVAKLNSFGDVIWAISGGGAFGDAAYGVAISPTGEVFVTGEFKGQAIFGTIAVTSANFQGSSVASPDIFTAKISTSGSWVWVETGSGNGADRGMDVDIDAAGNCYVVGQFSNDISFDVLHPNTIVNAGFVVKYSPSGAEQWFVKMGATQVLPYAVSVDGSSVYVAGESIGQMIYFASNTLIVPVTSNYSAFLGKISTAGSVEWGVEDGSSSYVSFRDVESVAGQIYLGGAFQCIFDEYALELGSGLFNSAGFKDSFGAAYGPSGNRIWMRQYGGPNEDICHGVAAYGLDDVVMAGGFEKIFNVPNNQGLFTSNATNFTPPATAQYVYPNQGSELCGYASYGAFVHVKAAGNRDMYVGRLFNEMAPHYDYYIRANCSFDIVENCVGTENQPLICSESAEDCGEERLYGQTNTGSSCFIGPEYDMNWHTGSGAFFIDIETSGWATWTLIRTDGCSSSTDSIYVTILPLPIPLITDSENINILEPPNAEYIQLCAPDEVTLTGGSADGQNGWWATPNGPIIATSITVTESGSYAYVIEGANGCVEENTISVEFVVPLLEIDPLLQFEDLKFDLNDTLSLCGNQYISFQLIDLLNQQEFPVYTDALWTIIYNGEFIEFEDDAAIEYDFLPEGTGTYEIIVVPYLHVEPPCPIDTIWYPEQSLSLYVEVLETPNIIMSLSGSSILCEGDTLTYVATSNSPFIWSGPQVNGLTVNSIGVTNPGTYGISSTVTYENGCEDTESLSLTAAYPSSPQLTTNPSHNVLCPGGSIEIISPSADAYQWIGPLGQLLSTNQSITVSSAGSYYCVLTTGSCVIESGVIEIQAYATPYIVALPSYDLCLEGFVTLVVQANPQAIVNWNAPLSGSSLTQNVFLPNTYSVEITFCNITSEVDVVITSSNPEPLITATGQNACPGEPIGLFGPPNMDQYLWMPGNLNADTLWVINDASYTLAVTDTNGCVGSSPAYVVSFYNISAPNPNDALVCYGESANVVGTGPNVFWSSDPNGVNIIGVGNVFVSPPIFGPYTIYVFREDENCRSQIEPLTLDVNPTSMAFILTQETSWCAGSNAVLESNTAGLPQTSHQWQTPSGIVNNQGVLALNSAQGSSSGWYILNVSGGGCTSPLDSVWVLIEEPFAEDLMDERLEGVCQNNSLVLSTIVELENIYWETPTGIVNNDIVSIITANETHNGWYILNGDGVACKQIFDSVLVSVREYPVIDLGPSDVYCDGGYMTAHVPEGYDLYQWSTGDTDADAVVPLDGLVWVMVTNWPNCTVSDTIEVETIDCISDFPNVFTPNGDGDNDYVDFGWLRIPIEEVHIYNRWGNLIRHLVGEPFVWNGRNDSGELVSDGVYYYVISSPNAGGQFHNVEGYIHTLGSGQGVNGQ